MITGNGYSLKRFPLLPLLFWIRFLTAFKRENKNYGVSPLWLTGNNPLLLFCASFFSKASKFSFLKIFNSILEDKQKRAATVILISYQGLCFSFLLPLLINLLFGLLDIVWNAHLHAGRTWKFRCAQRADKEMWRGSYAAEGRIKVNSPKLLLSERGHLGIQKCCWCLSLGRVVGKEREYFSSEQGGETLQ